MTNGQRLTTAPKELLQQLRAPACQHAPADLHLVVQLGVIQDLKHGMYGAGLGIVSAKYQTLDPGVHQSAGTHRARLNCNKQVTAAEAVIAQGFSGLAQGDDFGVGGGIGVGEVAVATAAYDRASAYDDGADGNFSHLQGALGGAQGLFHP
jgi:hypothetical protein